MEKALDSDKHYLLPLPPGLHSESPEMFGFFTYEFRVGHYRYTDSSIRHQQGQSVWSTSQGRFGRALRATGIQHPPPTLLCMVNRDEEKLYVNAPYALAVHKGKNVTSDPPRTELWCLLYAQVRQVDNKDFRNVLLDDKRLDWRVRVEHHKKLNRYELYDEHQRAILKHVSIMNWKDEIDYGKHRHTYKLADTDNTNKDGTKYGTVVWTNNEINQILDLIGLPRDSPLSIVCVEILPQITNSRDYYNNPEDQLRRQFEDILFEKESDNVFSQIPQENILNRDETSSQTNTQHLVNINEHKPLSSHLGQYRILRTSPLTEVPFICCSDCS
jgi:hypothetical protein